MDAQNRIKSIAMVHELLYSTEEFSKVKLGTYYERLIDSISGNMDMKSQEIAKNLDIQIESLNITQAIPLGLLINELVTNSIKYAFPEPQPDCQINLSISRKDRLVSVEYTDNGVGFSMSSPSFKAGLGFQIMDSLLQQLEATYELEPHDGFTIRFTFPEEISG